MTAAATANSTLELAVIGNCATSALVDAWGRIVWWCYPFFDGDPVCCELLQGSQRRGHGVLAVELEGAVAQLQHYEANTAVLRTLLTDADGNQLEIIDYAPRMQMHGRMYTPTMLVRRLRRLAGRPRVRVLSMLSHNWGEEAMPYRLGAHHVSFGQGAGALRLTTDGSVSQLMRENYTEVSDVLTLMYGPDDTVDGSPDEIGLRLLEGTRDFWRGWVRGLAVPFEWQDVVIRAAITLKLSAFDPTGAVIAAVTTSIPEAPHTVRNWDYRYCWIRDAYFVIAALNRLGATSTMESYLSYILNLIGDAKGGWLQPVYGLHREAELTETVSQHLPGYRDMGPVRVGNLAWIQRQGDVHGAAILAATHVFFDCRLPDSLRDGLFERLESVGAHALLAYDQPDAGIWELRGTQRVHTFSAMMCWAAVDRLARIAAHLGRGDRQQHWGDHAERIHAHICKHAWNEQVGSFVSTFGGEQLDASLLLMGELQFLPANDPRWRATVHVCEQRLRRGNFLLRYDEEDDFGRPEVAFVVCTLWWILALAHIGERERAREAYKHVLAIRTRLGMLSEDVNPDTSELWGNFPQTYSMVGLIQCAMRLSTEWDDAF